MLLNIRFMDLTSLPIVLKSCDVDWVVTKAQAASN